MTASELISDSIPTVSLEETGLKALNLMEVFHVNHLPVVNGAEYFGIISDQDIYNADNFEEQIEQYGINMPQPHVHRNQHIFEVVGIASQCGVTVVPVLDMDHSYMGAISQREVNRKLSDLVAVNEPGGIIVLELCKTDYSLSQIAQIVESNDAKILSFYVSRPSESSKELDVTIKLNKMDLSGVIQTFTRYDYNIKATYMDDSRINNLYDDRFDQFMRYLNT
ncbi:acetoin utilization protein [Prolixibacter bellariivorans]|uniref:Acetoin utilization protein n=1 Tax=Prolixibacter bellariivorans TaxID=314319 RepID=A0A5M4AW33_9BACT|nr:CBS domain-containing protein [Prolixibacter bellariivorans]GET31781.1 acetoin utilization protein [Prolixibacter bellariivorans]